MSNLENEISETIEKFDKKIEPEKTEKKIILLLGEGNFSFTKSLIENKTYPDHIIIATDLNNSLCRKDSEYIQSFYALDFEGLNETLFIDFGVDVTKLDWPGLFKKLFKQEKVRNPDIIQFNFPWRHFDSEFSTHQIVSGVFEAASGLLDTGGLLKLGLVDTESTYYKDYDLDDCLIKYNNRFQEVSKVRFMHTYPGYRHASSISSKKVFDIDIFGVEKTFKKL